MEAGNYKLKLYDGHYEQEGNTECTKTVRRTYDIKSCQELKS